MIVEGHYEGAADLSAVYLSFGQKCLKARFLRFDVLTKVGRNDEAFYALYPLVVCSGQYISTIGEELIIVFARLAQVKEAYLSISVSCFGGELMKRLKNLIGLTSEFKVLVHLSSSREDLEKLRMVIFGAGQVGRNLLKALRREFDVVAIVDNDLEKEGSLIDGVEVLLPRAISGVGVCRGCIASMWGVEIKKQLVGMGFSSVLMEILQ